VGTIRVAGIQITVTQPWAADLLPVSPDGNADTDFCRWEYTDSTPPYLLSVDIRNQGGSGAGASTLRVTFQNLLDDDQPDIESATTPVLGVNETATVKVPFPEYCFGHCAFTMVADYGTVIFEGPNEGNNTRRGECLNEGEAPGSLRTASAPIFSSVRPTALPWIVNRSEAIRPKGQPARRP
jgi:hypothetical protein